MGMALGAPGGDRFPAWFKALIELVIVTPLYPLLQLGAAIASWVAFFSRRNSAALAISRWSAFGGVPMLIAAYIIAYAFSITATP